MSTLPDRYDELLEFLRYHAARWAADPGAVGLSEEQALLVAQASEEAAAAYQAAYTARLQAETATNTLHAALRDARAAAGQAIRTIRAFAESAPHPIEVYSAASIAPPDDPSPIPAPGTPEYTGCALDPGGALTIRWKCRNPRGSRNVVYLVQRRTPGGAQQAWTFLGATGVKRFTDESLPAGTPWAEYRITARRGAKEGSPCIRRVNLGSVTLGSVTLGAVGAGGSGAAPTRAAA
jgi:hypothetical protein